MADALVEVAQIKAPGRLLSALSAPANQTHGAGFSKSESGVARRTAWSPTTTGAPALRVLSQQSQASWQRVHEILFGKLPTGRGSVSGLTSRNVL